MCLYRCLYNYGHANKARCCCNCRPKIHITFIKMSGGEKKKRTGKHTKEEIESLGVVEKDL